MVVKNLKGLTSNALPGGFPRNISIPTPVDVSATGMAMQAKKIKALKGARGTTVSYSGIKTSSQGLLGGANIEKKTLLGG